MRELHPAVMRALERSREYGFLGPGPVDIHVRQASAFSSLLEAEGLSNARLGDLGAGGGVPGLVVASLLPEVSLTFLDVNQRRMAFVAECLEELGWSDRCRVVVDRAESIGRQPQLRHSFDGVIARGFSAPAVTAECAAPLLRIGGLLVVSDPPEDSARWPASGLATVGLSGRSVHHDDFAFFLGRLESPCPDRFPRRVGIPSKRPLF